MTKLIVSDIDGTLINSNHKVTQHTRDTIAKAIKSGYRFMLATGRNYQSASEIAKDLGINPEDIPIVCLNGMFVKHPRIGYDVSESSMSYEDCEMMAEIGKSFYMCVLYCYEDKIFYHMDDRSLEDFEIGMSDDRTRLFGNTQKMERISELSDLKERFSGNIPILKMVFMQNPDYVELVQERISEIFTADYNLLMVGQGWAEIMPKHINKGDAILEYAASVGIEVKDIIAFGDSDNDLTMIQKVGCGVAMANARKSLKIIADEQTVSNDEDGVACYIDQFLL